KTVIGYGSPNKSDSAASHGAPLGTDEVTLTKEYYKWTYEEDFYVPSDVYEDFKEKIIKKGEQKEAEWNQLFEEYKTKYPAEAEEIETEMNGEIPDGWDKDLSVYVAGGNVLGTLGSTWDLITSL